MKNRYISMFENFILHIKIDFVMIFRIMRYFLNGSRYAVAYSRIIVQRTFKIIDIPFYKVYTMIS